MSNAPTAPTAWPEGCDPHLARIATEHHMLAYHDRMTPAALGRVQAQCLGRVLEHATRHSAWWRAWVRPAMRDEGLAFALLPPMRREDYRASLADADGPLPLRDEHEGAYPNATSGSSGIPLRFHQSGNALAMSTAQYRYDRIRHGLDPNRLFARLTAQMETHDGPHVCVPGHPLAGRGPEVRRRSKSFTIEENARWLAGTGAAYVVAPAGILLGILDSYEQGSAPLPTAPIDALLSFAETVTPALRAQARRVLGARVLDRYSCEEIGPLAFQCPHHDTHYHIAGTNALVEVLDEAGRPSPPDTPGRVHATSLHNYASPVVRYELGDLAAWAPACPCGYDKPVLHTLLGRTRFLIRLPSGQRRHVAFTARHWLDVAPFREARLVQVSREVIHAEYVLDRALMPEEADRLVTTLRAVISPDLTYAPIRRARIDWGPTYKRQDVVSLI